MVFLLCVVIALVALIAWRAASKKVQEKNQSFKGMAGFAGLAAVVFIILAVLQCFTIIPAGNVGVVDVFGVVSDNTMKAGINPINPLAHVIKFSIQTTEHKETMQVLSREGLTIGLEISVLYHLEPDSAASVYRKIGTDYTEVVLIPQFRSISRAVTASFQASALYSSEREKLGTDIQEELARAAGPRGLVVESTPLRNVALPQQLTEAIEQKQRAEQESQRMEFILTKEKQEADRKGIEATEKLAASSNTKVIIVGAGKDGLPVILDTK